MYRRAIDFDSDSFLEIVSRITGGGEQLMLAMRGRKNNAEATVASVILNQDEVKELIEGLTGWIDSEPATLDAIGK
jgi:hypothetical protein